MLSAVVPRASAGLIAGKMFSESVTWSWSQAAATLLPPLAMSAAMSPLYSLTLSSLLLRLFRQRMLEPLEEDLQRRQQNASLVQSAG